MAAEWHARKEVTTRMADQSPQNTREIDTATLLAVERTRVAYDRTMLAWLNTAIHLITFGFTIYQFFVIENSPGSTGRLVGPRKFALSLIGVGLISLLLAAVGNRKNIATLRAIYPGSPRSPAALLAGCIAIVGILTMLAVLFRV